MIKVMVVDDHELVRTGITRILNDAPGIVVIADSAQFSASVIELSNPQLTGTMVTVQTCIGFLLTTATIHAIPYMVDGVGWRYAFMFLAFGPFMGVWAMGILRKMPEAEKLANGKK